MASIWDNLAGGIYNVKSALGLQDVNLVPGDVNKKLTGASAQYVYGTPVPGQNARDYSLNDPSIKTTQRDQILTGATTTTGGGGGGGTKTPAGSPTPQQTTNNMVDDAARQQEEAARAAAEAKRQAAMRKYEAQTRIAGSAKEEAKGQYDWLIDTLGSNKKDALEQVALNRDEGLANYGQQEAKTKELYDGARQEILTTYRDLNIQQEKILRGSGSGSSSRSQEAMLRLNNLMGKDLTGVSKNEADSIALIGNAVTSLKNKSIQAEESIQRETKTKLDKAALDYNSQITAIDNNLYLSANEKEDAYSQAEAQLAADTANIQTWASGVKLQYQQAAAKNTEMLNGLVTSLTSDNELLTADLTTKRNATNEVLTAMGFTPLSENPGEAAKTNTGVYQKTSAKYQTKEELDAAYQRGEIDALAYQSNLNQIQLGGGSKYDLGSSPTAGASATPTTRAMKDPLLSAIFA